MEKQRSFRLLLIPFLLFGYVAFSQHFIPVWEPDNPYMAMTPIIVSNATLDGVVLSVNDEIAVFDIDQYSGDEICVGTGTVTGSGFPLAFPKGAGADDPSTTDVQEGFINNHDIIWRYWDDSEQKEYTLIDTAYDLTSGNVDYYASSASVLVSLTGFSADTWTGSASDDWNATANWATGLIPLASADVIIPTTGVTNYPTLTSSSTGECNHLIIQSDASGDGSILGDQFLTVNGTTTVQRYLSGGMWHDLTASATGQTVNCMYFGGNPDVWLRQYNEPDNTRTYITDLSTPMPSGAGFEVWVETGNNVTLDYTGPLQTSDVTLNSGSTPALSYTNGVPRSDYGYNLIGNPFASPIDLDNGSWAMTNVLSSVYVWDPNYNGGSFRDYNMSTHVGSITNGIIPMGQGFFVQASSSSPSMTLPVDARVHAAQSYYKKAAAQDDTPAHLVLRAVSDDGYDEINIAFLEGASESFDIYDTRKLFAFEGDFPQVYAIQSDEDLGINALPPLQEEGSEVKVGFKTGITGEQQLVANLDELPETHVLLEDLITGDVQDLNKNPVYQFSSTVGDDPGRFILHFNQTVSDVEAHPENTGITIYAYDGSVYIKSMGKAANSQKQVMIYDTFGRTILKTLLKPATLNRIPVNGAQGYLIVRAISGNTVNTTKVFVK